MVKQPLLPNAYLEIRYNLAIEHLTDQKKIYIVVVYNSRYSVDYKLIK